MKPRSLPHGSQVCRKHCITCMLHLAKMASRDSNRYVVCGPELRLSLLKFGGAHAFITREGGRHAAARAASLASCRPRPARGCTLSNGVARRCSRRARGLRRPDDVARTSGGASVGSNRQPDPRSLEGGIHRCVYAQPPQPARPPPAARRRRKDMIYKALHRSVHPPPPPRRARARAAMFALVRRTPRG